MSEREKVKRKIHFLLQKTTDNGCTKEEALSAAEKAGELMSHWNLSITEIELKDERCQLVKIPTQGKRRGAIDNLMVGLARYCEVKLWFSHYSNYEDKKARYCAYGLSQDVEVFEYLYHYLSRALETAANEFKTTSAYLEATDNWYRETAGAKRVALGNFKRAFADELNVSINALRRERDEYMAKMQAEVGDDVEVRERRTGTNIVFVKQQFVEDEFEKNVGIRLTKHRSYSRRQQNWDAQAAGRNAAGKVSIRQAVGGREVKAIG